MQNHLYPSCEMLYAASDAGGDCGGYGRYPHPVPLPITNRFLRADGHHAEETVYDTTGGLIIYDLTIVTDTYRLAANGTAVLTGPVRERRAVNPALSQLTQTMKEEEIV